MADRPYVSFAEVKQKVAMPEVLDILGIADRFVQNRDTLSGICPLPRHQHGPKPNSEQFKINLRDGVWVWHCFGDCQKGGDVIELVKEMTGYDDAHVRFWFAEKFGDRLKSARPAKVCKAKAATTSCQKTEGNGSPTAGADETPAQLPTLKPLRFRLSLTTDVPYLRDRGLSDDTIARFGLGLCNRGVLKGYVAIPVYSHRKSLIDNPLAYLGRWPGDDFDESSSRPRYKWPDGFSKSQIIYGLREALESDSSQPLIIVEGPFKVYHLVQAGFPNVVATFGSSMSDEQAGILAETGRSILLLFDGDEAGRNGMRTAAGKLITRAFVRAVRLPDGTEPDDLTADELAELLT